MDPFENDVTHLLHRIGEGDPSAANELFPLLVHQLRNIAEHHLRDQRVGHTLQPTALVNEAWLRLRRQQGDLWEGRKAFFAVASRAMRSVLVDHARARSAAKRSAGNRVQLSETLVALETAPVDVLALDEALTELARVDVELERIVDLLFFGGLSTEEAAEVLSCSPRTVQRGWRTARAWLSARLFPDESSRGTERDPLADS